MSHDVEAREHRSAQRFMVDVPVLMKTAGSDREVVHSTRDVSHRGVFVYTDHPLPEASPVQFVLKLKTVDGPEEGIRILCSGTVVRVEQPVSGRHGMAATIDSYRFLYKSAHA